MENIKTMVKSWNRFLTRNLAVTRDGLGQKHVFPFENTTVTINIPDIDRVDDEVKFGSGASIGARRSIDNEPVEYDIHSIDVEVQLPLEISLPAEVLERAPNAYDLFSQDEQKNLNNNANYHKSIAEKHSITG